MAKLGSSIHVLPIGNLVRCIIGITILILHFSFKLTVIAMAVLFLPLGKKSIGHVPVCRTYFRIFHSCYTPKCTSNNQSLTFHQVLARTLYLLRTNLLSVCVVSPYLSAVAPPVGGVNRQPAGKDPGAWKGRAGGGGGGREREYFL